MTNEEIEALRKKRKAERDRLYRQREDVKARNRIRSRENYAKMKERMAKDPAYREHVKAIWRKHYTSGKNGRPFTLTEVEMRHIKDLHERGWRTSSIARHTLLPYHKVLYYVNNVLKKNGG